MATEALKSAQITNADATPAVLNPAYQAGGRVRVHRGKVVAVLAAADVGSTYRFCRIRSSDMVVAVYLDNGAFGGAAAADFGLYRTAADGGAVVDADFFASALAVITAAQGVNITRESLVITPANLEKRVWEALGLSADPMVEYDVAATVTTIFAAAENMVVTVLTAGGH